MLQNSDLAPEKVAFFSGGHKLVGTLQRSKVPARAAVLLHGATGVRHSYYKHFAEWLSAEFDVAVLTYDYRDFGESSVGPIQKSRATMTDWGVHDQAAAQLMLEQKFPDLPIWIVGHSLGAMGLAFQKSVSRVERFIAVASGPVYSLTDHPWPYRTMALSFWFGHGFILNKTLGHIPSWSGFGTVLPKGVYSQWRRWCTSKGFYEGDFGRELPEPNWHAFKGQARFVAVNDDVLIPPECVWRLARRYKGGEQSKILIKPEDYSLDKIGHIGVFCKANEQVWPLVMGDSEQLSKTQ